MSDRSDEETAAERLADLEAKVTELRRVNAELGRELRLGAASRQPRSPAVAARALAKLTNERDTARAELEQTRAELEQARAELAGTRTSLKTAEDGVAYLSEQFDGLRLETERLRHEAFRLRSGGAGLLRRLRARLLRR
ncbi:MAG TPA: hypothetical protein VJ989_09620 [Solirubrobacterales bacterium]|nr:hypothetical protein [Solirubrobacterales bacterium]